MTDRTWEIRAEHNLGELTVMRFNGFAADSEGPTIYDREQFEEFISNLRHAAATLWPDAPIPPHPAAPQGIAIKGPDVGMCGRADTLRARGNEVRDLDGGAISRTDYPELYALIRDKFGAAEPDEFRLPDLRGRVVDE